MNREETFAYMVFACQWSPELEAELADWYWGDFVECSLKSEEQAEEPSAVWAYDLDYELSRIAPVQMTFGWDVRPTLLQTFQQVAVEPLFRGADRGEVNWLAFPTPREPLQWQQIAPQNTPKPVDFQRFQEVVDATVELAKAQNGSLLFVGGSGFGYGVDDETFESSAPILKEAGMKFFDRHG